MLTPKDRIQQLLEYYEINANQFSLKIKLKPQNIYDIIYGKTKNISLKVADSIKAVYQYVSMEWLLTGRGEMMDSIAYDDVPAETDAPTAEKGEQEEVKTIEEIEGLQLRGCKAFVNVFCSSMRPAIEVGDQLLVSKWEEGFITWGKPYIVETKKGNHTIAYLFPSEKKGFYLCRSANPEKYPDVEVPIEDVKDLYIVLSKINAL